MYYNVDSRNFHKLTYMSQLAGNPLEDSGFKSRAIVFRSSDSWQGLALIRVRMIQNLSSRPIRKVPSVQKLCYWALLPLSKFTSQCHVRDYYWRLTSAGQGHDSQHGWLALVLGWSSFLHRDSVLHWQTDSRATPGTNASTWSQELPLCSRCLTVIIGILEILLLIMCRFFATGYPIPEKKLAATANMPLWEETVTRSVLMEKGMRRELEE